MYFQSLLKEYLDLKKIPYEHQVHRTAYTAQEVADEERISGMMVAKTVVFKADNRFVMAVLPAPMKVDLVNLKAALRAGEVRLATETEFKGLFPDAEVGAMPPFGNLYGIPVYVEESLTRDPKIVFNAGTHQDTIRMNYEDFSRLVEPKICSFALKHAA
jgi:Ala-tRNA(Pro) deacylase